MLWYIYRKRGALPHDTPILLDEIVMKTQEILRYATKLHTDYLNQRDLTELQAAFAGCCGLAQCVAGYAFQDLGVPAKPLATQSLEGYWMQGHAALVVEVSEGPDSGWYLIDPTFCQFCVTQASEAAPSPSNYLKQSSAGLDIITSLRSRGYLKLTPENAALYLSAFCKGIAPLQSDEAMAFMKNPPPHPYHFRRDIECDDYSRENLARYNQLIDCSSPSLRSITRTP